MGKRTRLIVAACAVVLSTIGVAGSSCVGATSVTSSPATAEQTTVASTTTSGVTSPANSTVTSADFFATATISGPVFAERPKGTILFTARWGVKPGEVGHEMWERNAPSKNPIEVSVSPDMKSIALLDYANGRVEIYSRDGKLQRVIAAPATADLAAVAWGQDSVQPFNAQFKVLWKDASTATILVFNSESSVSYEVRISSPDLPMNEIRALGIDASGSMYAMIRIYEQNWTGTESWWFIGVGHDGAYLGHLRLPLDSWAGSGYALSPNGNIVELRSTKNGITVSEYELDLTP